MYFLNYIYFAIITYFGIKFLTSGGRIVKNPLVKDQKMKLDGPEMFWVLTFSTGLLAFSAPAGLDLMAIRLMVLEVLCIIGLMVVKNKPVWTLPLGLYVVYLLWVIIGCFYSPAPMYGFRVVLKYLYPLLIALLASAAVRNVEVFVKAGLGARFVAALSLIYYFVPGVASLSPGAFWYGTAGAINFISIMIFSLALFYYTNEKRKNLFWAVLFIIPCFVWVFRTSIMGSLVAIMGFYFIKYKVRSLPIIGGILVAGVIAVFTIPSLHEKMFKDSSTNIDQFQDGKLSMDDVNTNARASMWEHLEDRFFVGHELTGSGTGSVQNYMYTHTVFGGLKVPHSDLVQLKCDTGMIGLVLYAVAGLMIFLHCFLKFQTARSVPLKLCAITAGASLAGVLVTLYSDNVVNYSMATLSMPFGFYGMMLGLSKTYK